MSVLVVAEHDNASLKDATLAAVTAAGELGGEVHLLVAGFGAQAAARRCGQGRGRHQGFCSPTMSCSSMHLPRMSRH